MDQQNNSNLATPIAIVLAGIIIAGAMYFGNSRPADAPIAENPQVVKDTLDQVRPVSADDHIRGNPNAEAVIVEYSDTECPFCGLFHNAMKQIMDEYGKSGKVAWVYRHSPLDQIHKKSRMEAVALECANELGGNDKFWAYTDRIYEVTPANDGLDVSELPKIAQYVGLDVAKFNSCLVSGKYELKIQADLANADATGGNGTPWNVVILKNSLSEDAKSQISKYVITKNIFDNRGNPLIYVSENKNQVALGGAMPLEIIKDILNIIFK